VMGIFPGTLSPTPYEADGQVGYPVGFLLGPGERVDIEIRLLPRKAADWFGMVEVRAGEQIVESGLRMAFDRGVTPAAQPYADPHTHLDANRHTQCHSHAARSCPVPGSGADFHLLRPG
jgi:hypothetical protein